MNNDSDSQNSEPVASSFFDETEARQSELRAVKSLWARILTISLLGVFLAEFVVMGVFLSADQPLGVWIELAFLDSLVLSLLVLPGIYLVVLRPVARMAGRLAAAAADARFRTVVDAASDAIIVSDRSGVIRFANPAAYALLGYGSGELEGKPTSTLVPEKYLKRHEEAIRLFAKGGTGRVTGGGTLKVEALTKDGNTVPVEVSLAAPREPGAGFIVAVLRDIRLRQRVDLLESLLPVCCMCGVVRDDTAATPDHERWCDLEEYVHRHSTTRFSHTFCPKCYRQYLRNQGLTDLI